MINNNPNPYSIFDKDSIKDGDYFCHPMLPSLYSSYSTSSAAVVSTDSSSSLSCGCLSGPISFGPQPSDAVAVTPAYKGRKNRHFRDNGLRMDINVSAARGQQQKRNIWNGNATNNNRSSENKVLSGRNRSDGFRSLRGGRTQNYNRDNHFQPFEEGFLQPFIDSRDVAVIDSSSICMITQQVSDSRDIAVIDSSSTGMINRVLSLSFQQYHQFPGTSFRQ